MNHGLRTISGKIYGHTTVNTRIFLTVYALGGDILSRTISAGYIVTSLGGEN